MSKITDAASAAEYNYLSDLWLNGLSGIIPVDDMIIVFTLLLRDGKTDLATELLELALEEMEKAGGDGDVFSELLRKSACLFSNSELLRKSLVESLRDEYLMFQPLEHFLKLSGLTETNADIKKTWYDFMGLMKYIEGGYVFHQMFGPGRIIRVSRTSITIDFQKAANHDMELDIALETTIPLEPDSLTVLRWCDPSGFLHLFDNSPAEFLKRLLQEPFGNPEEITLQNLAPVFKDSEIKNTEAWKRMKKTASIMPGFVDLGDRIVLKDETIKEYDQIRNIINRRKCPVSDKTKEIQALLKSSGAVKSVLMADLLDDVKEISSPETGSLFELSWTLTGKGKTDDFIEFSSNYIEKTSARGLRAVSEIHSLSCRKLYLELFFSGEADRGEKLRLMMKLKRSLWEHCAIFLEKTDPELLNECIGFFLSDPSETDRFLWALVFLADRGKIDNYPSDSDQIELFIKYLVFARADTQKKVICLLMGSLKEDLDRYLASIDTRRLSNYLDIFDNISTAHREGLFLALGRELSRRRNSNSIKPVKRYFWESDMLFSSREAIDKLSKDALRLKQVEIPAAASEIGEAASHGDLSENAEYVAAIEKRDFLLAKLRRWNEELKRYRFYPSSELNTETVSPGTRILLKNSGDPDLTRIMDIVGPLDAGAGKGRINYKAPIGKIVLGKAPGDIVMFPGTDEDWEIVSIKILKEAEKG